MEAREMFTSRAEMIDFISDRDGLNCYLCGDPFTESRRVTIDHYHPQSKGGTWDIENLRLAHKKCNTEKGDRLFVDGVLEPKTRKIGYRERKQNKQETLESFCELCYDGRLLFPGEICPECEHVASRWPWSTKKDPKECDHNIYWCWVEAIEPGLRRPAIETVLDVDYPIE